MSVTYSKEIDGLRALSVIIVMLFHTNNTTISGGYIGVDVFFVISGFLITSVIQGEFNRAGTISFIKFYNKRFARLLPAIIITLVATFSFGFIFYDPVEFDSLGKDIFFSGLGVKNFLDATGTNYFVQDERVKPLLHMWSLGVEEQYYVIWPLVLLLILRFFPSFTLLILSTLMVFLLAVSEIGVSQKIQGAYFLPQYRAVELLIGATIALIPVESRIRKWSVEPQALRTIICAAAFATLIVMAFLFNSQSKFPGLNSLLVTIPTVILILFSRGTWVGWILSRKTLVSIGLISYPLYLFHQPLISAFLFFDQNINRTVLFILTFMIGSALSYWTYVFVEIPVRLRAKTPKGTLQATLLFILTISIAAVGLWVAKSSGVPQRLSLLNPYAYSVSQSLSSSFQKTFSRGVHISKSDQPKILFIGDSLLQQYVEPLVRHWGYKFDQVDVISRGGCVLLKGADYEDSFSDISCDHLRDVVFQSDQRYEKVVISQGWHLYGGKILNALSQDDEYGPYIWKPFIENTVSYFDSIADKVYLIGPHPKISGECNLKISPFTTEQSISSCLGSMRMEFPPLRIDTNSFTQSLDDISVNILLPMELWCDGEKGSCYFEDNGQPYFRDRYHFGTSATGFLLNRMKVAGW